MYVGIARIEFRIVGARSLKEKRHVLRKMLDRVRSRFKVTAGEVGFLDKWQRTAIGVSVVGPDASHLSHMLDEICGYLDALQLAEPLRIRREVIPFGGDVETLGDLETFGDDAPDHDCLDGVGIEDPLDGLVRLGDAARRARPVGEPHHG